MRGDAYSYLVGEVDFQELVQIRASMKHNTVKMILLWKITIRK